MARIHLIGFFIFLIIYSFVKYRAVPELMGQSAYIQSTIILIFLTAIIPYGLAWFTVKKLSGKGRVITAGLLPLLLCGIGLATYFFVFIAPNAPGMSVMQVLPRAIIPGLVMGALLAVPMLIHKET